jgi:putative ABC transport system permease protein
MMKHLLFDLRQAFRALRVSPGVAISATAMLAVGLGLVMYMYGAIESMILRPPPFPDADRIVHFEIKRTADGSGNWPVTLHDYLDFKAAQTQLEPMGAYHEGTVNVSGGDQPERYDGAFLTAEIFEILGVPPLLGRTFTMDESAVGAAPVVVLGHALWQHRYAGNPDILGQVIRVNGREATVIGVMPPDFSFPRIHDIWVPLNQDTGGLPRGGGVGLDVIGRLQPGVAVVQAQSEFQTILDRINGAYPDAVTGDRAVVKRAAEEWIGGETRRILQTMLAAVILVLLISCANVAGLLGARTATRRHDLAIRAALGASRYRLMRQLLAETFLIAMAATFIGYALAQIGGEITLNAVAMSEDPPPRWSTEFVITADSMLVALGAALLTAILAGLVPAWRGTRAAAGQIIRGGGRGLAGGVRGRGAGWLVAGEIALALVLLVTAVLTVRNAQSLVVLDSGAEIDGVITGRVALMESAYPDNAKARDLFRRMREQLVALPDSTDATVATSMPMTFAGSTTLWTPDQAHLTQDRLPRANHVVMAENFFEFFAVPVVSGRGFTSADRAGTRPVAVVSRQVAERLWPGRDAVGQRLRFGMDSEPERVVVGVAEDVVHDLEDLVYGSGRIRGSVYAPIAQSEVRFASFAVRSRDPDPYALSAGVRGVVSSLDADLPVYWLRTLDDWIRANTFDFRLMALMFGLFGLCALGLAAAGIYGLLAYAVARRTQEIGVRRAVGARSSRIVAWVVGHGLAQLAAGAALGIALAIPFGRLIGNVLYQVAPTDPATLGYVIVIFAAVVMLASLAPTLRALRIQPMEALRYE